MSVQISGGNSGVSLSDSVVAALNAAASPSPDNPYITSGAPSLRLGTNGTTAGEFRIAALGPGMGDWWMASFQSIFNEHPNDIMFIGKNWSNSGKEVPSRHSWFIGLEDEFWYTATDRACEFYLNMIDSDGVGHRPIQIILDIDDETAITTLVGQHTFLSDSGTLLMSFSDGVISLTASTGQIRHETNSVPLIRQKNGAGNGYKGFTLNSADQMILDTSSLTYGDILVGSGATTYYNLSVNAGGLGNNNGTGVIHIRNASVVPSTAYANIGTIYAEAGALKYRSPGGTVTTIAPN